MYGYYALKKRLTFSQTSHCFYVSKVQTLWEKEKLLVTILFFPRCFSVLYGNFQAFSSNLKPYENTVEQGEIARNEQIILFPSCFLPFYDNFHTFSSNLKLSSANSLSLEESKIRCLEKV